MIAHSSGDLMIRIFKTMGYILLDYIVTTNVSWIHPNKEINPQITLLTTNHETADKRTHALLTETAFNHQLSTKQPSKVTTITLLKHTSDSQKTPSKLGTETPLRQFVTQNTGTLRNSVNMSGPWKTTTLTILFHGVSFYLAHPTTFQVKDVTFASKRNF